MLSEDEIYKISNMIFKKLVEHYDNLAEEENNKTYVVNPEDFVRQAVSEEDLLYLQLDRLYQLEKRYIDHEEYLKANIVLNKINRIKEKLKNL
ncbi:MAG: hypothetical protein CBC57_03640 [Euryarchaeota archaeon TMED97]|nr:MAG: hypothetical protein CBC57_03640 [Euryarchaeota archaeon TMED97]|tara:strand:- start:10607 stop:10885 length:279 start_codon:yes stop_codon:yes gene_type:complete